ncbi:MAG: hypothetical protein WA117_26610 [Verrucomicrobiia bacterium]
MPLEHDIVERIEQEFSSHDAPTALELLRTAGKSGRIARCIVFAAIGNLEALRRYIQVADQDYRDMILVGEYDDMHRQLRDFRTSFLIDAPVKMWISHVAVVLAGRGYFLSSVETVPVEAGATARLSDLGEGVAIFDGDLGQIRVAKHRRQWILTGDIGELESYDLAKAFADEREFSDAVSCYILAKRKANKVVAPNGGPATLSGDSGVTEGPPSLGR